MTMSEDGVSPAVGVILMVVITVILAAVIALFVFALAGTVESSGSEEEIHAFRVGEVYSGYLVDGDRFYSCGECGWIHPGDDITVVVRQVKDRGPLRFEFFSGNSKKVWRIREVLAMSRGRG